MGVARRSGLHRGKVWVMSAESDFDSQNCQPKGIVWASRPNVAEPRLASGKRAGSWGTRRLCI
jgi:hypothetical protein